ncbi:hypothetical protein V3390_09215 [Luteimonas sp. FXH3W]|uniref:Uncharacterized protein n=1 Tax=Aquilutibacter rugosus TaxID=3115820 RepID=A0ABU7V0U5_9GAMM
MNDIERGQLAEAVLKNEVFQDAFAQINTEVFNEWQREPNEAKRNELWQLMQATKRLQTLLTQAMNNGKVELKRQSALGRMLKLS